MFCADPMSCRTVEKALDQPSLRYCILRVFLSPFLASLPLTAVTSPSPRFPAISSAVPESQGHFLDHLLRHCTNSQSVSRSPFSLPDPSGILLLNPFLYVSRQPSSSNSIRTPLDFLREGIIPCFLYNDFSFFASILLAFPIRRDQSKRV